jgi:hypothetical protein
MLLCCFDLVIVKQARAPAGFDATANIHNAIIVSSCYKHGAVCLSFMSYGMLQLANCPITAESSCESLLHHVTIKKVIADFIDHFTDRCFHRTTDLLS